MGQQVGHEEKDQGCREQGPVVGTDKAGHAGNALAAPESHIEGIIMSQYAAREGIGLKQIGHLRVGPAEQVPRGHDRENALESIHEEDQEELKKKQQALFPYFAVKMLFIISKIYNGSGAPSEMILSLIRRSLGM